MRTDFSDGGLGEVVAEVFRLHFRQFEPAKLTLYDAVIKCFNVKVDWMDFQCLACGSLCVFLSWQAYLEDNGQRNFSCPFLAGCP